MLIIGIVVLIIGFVNVLIYFGCNFLVVEYIIGSFVLVMFIGSLGMFFLNLFNNIIIGYMIFIGYLILNMMIKGKYVGKFFIMFMS